MNTVAAWNLVFVAASGYILWLAIELDGRKVCNPQSFVHRRDIGFLELLPLLDCIRPLLPYLLDCLLLSYCRCRVSLTELQVESDGLFWEPIGFDASVPATNSARRQKTIHFLG
jgi:hypothetical protein